MMNAVYLVVTVAVALSFFSIARLLAVRNRTVRKIMPALTIVELLSWTMIVFWSANMFLSARSYYPILVLTLAVLFTLMLTWFYLKDIVAGYIFRVRHNPVKGQTFTCGTSHGSLRKLGLSQLTVETEEGEWLRIPYSSVVNQTLSLQSPRQTVQGETTLELSINKWDNPVTMERVLRKVLAQSPWWIASKPINIEFFPEQHIIRISFFVLSPVYVQAIKERLASSLA